MLIVFPNGARLGVRLETFMCSRLYVTPRRGDRSWSEAELLQFRCGRVVE
jgi:hypothetical protein